MKKITKQIQSLYDYSQALDFMPPRGDGAKDAVAIEIHDEVKGVFNSMIKQLKGKQNLYFQAILWYNERDE